MIIFTINEDNNITAFAGTEEAAQAGDATATAFDSPAALAKISAEWPLSRFVDIWNSLPGNTAVKKFATSLAQLLSAQKGESVQGEGVPAAIQE